MTFRLEPSLPPPNPPDSLSLLPIMKSHLLLLTLAAVLPLAAQTSSPVKGIAVTAAPSSPAQAEILALCIGNNAYLRPEDQLDTPINDAQLMKRSLERLPGGAEVLIVTDGAKEAIDMQLNALKAKASARPYKLAFFYYSGHGVEDQPLGFEKPETFLLPTDAIIEDVNQLPTRAIALSSVLQRLNEMKTTVRAVVLDCCRDGAPKAAGALAGASKSITGGLDERVKAALGKAVVPEATLIAFAASPGRRAAAFLKESDSNSPFTALLSLQLTTGAGNLRDLVESAAELTEIRTEKRQVPYVNYVGAASSIRQITFRSKAEPLVMPELPKSEPVSAPMPQTAPPPSTPRPAGWETKKSPELIKAFADLAALDVTIQTERVNWQKAINVINKLTDFKRSPVRQGSPAYDECMRASKVIQLVESSAPDRIAERARLEAIIRAHGGDPSTIRPAATPAPAAP